VSVIPTAINDAGRVTAFATFANTEIGTPSVAVPIRIEANQQIALTSYLGTLNADPTKRHGKPFAINSDGEVVGSSATDAGDVAFFYDTAMHPLPGAGPNTVGTAINTSGVIVGRDDGAVRAVLWYKGKQVDMSTLLPAGSDWKLQTATAINNCGAIVGVGTRPLSDPSHPNAAHGYLLTPAMRAP